MFILTEKIASELLFEGESELTNHKLKNIEEEEWSGESKYFYKTIIFQDMWTKKYFQLSVSKTGSHYTDWTHEYELNCPEVKQVKKMVEVKEWEFVK